MTNTLVTGGAEHMLVSLARAFRPKRVAASVACLKEAGPLASSLTECGIAVHENLLRHKADVFVVDRLRGIFDRDRIDVVCAVGSGGDRMFWSALAARRAGRSCMVWSHMHPTPRHPGFERANRAIYRWVDRYVALGQRHRDALVRLEHLPAGRIEIIRNGIDVDAFDKPELRGEARRRLDLPDEQAVAVGLVANLRPAKRHDVFIEAARRAGERHSNAVFYVIGDGPLAAEVRQLAEASGLCPDRLRLLGERRDVDVLLQGLDIVCLCSDWQECLSLVMLEAMAAGRAFIGPTIGSLDEALIDGKTGRATQPGDPDSLARVLEELIADDRQRRRLGRAAREKVRAEFTTSRMTREFEALIRRLRRRRYHAT